jgi:hypothetical protein
MEDVTFGEAKVSLRNACSQFSKVPLQSVGKIPAAMCGSFPAKPLSTPARFSKDISPNGRGRQQGYDSVRERCYDNGI